MQKDIELQTLKAMRMLFFDRELNREVKNYSRNGYNINTLKKQLINCLVDRISLLLPSKKINNNCFDVDCRVQTKEGGKILD